MAWNADPGTFNSDWYDFTGEACEGYLVQLIGQHPDVCWQHATSDIISTLEDLATGEELYAYEEVVQRALEAGRRPVTDCKHCSCGRYLELEDGTVLNSALFQWVHEDAEHLYRIAAGDHADALLTLLLSPDIPTVQQGVELHVCVMPAWADRWLPVLCAANCSWLDDAINFPDPNR